MGSHIVRGKFQSDKYPTCPPGKVPLSVEDVTAQDLLWEYAQRRRAVDAEFAADLEAVLCAQGYEPRERLSLRRAFVLGALAMRRSAMAHCGNATESLQEGMMTDAGLSSADKKAMAHQINAIGELEDAIRGETPGGAAYYGSYILRDREKAEIKALFPDVNQRFVIEE